MTLLATVLATCLGGVFIYAVTSKVRDPMAFARAVRAYEVLPGQLAPIAAALLLVTEAFLGVSYLTGWLFVVATPVAVGTLVIFIVAVGLNLRRERPIACGCFGSTSERISRWTLARLALLLTAALTVGASSWRNAEPHVLLRIPSMGYQLEVMLLAVGALAAATWLLMIPSQLIPMLSTAKKVG